MREIKKKAKIFKVHIEGPPMEMLEINQSRIYKIIREEIEGGKGVAISVKRTSSY